MKEHRIFSTRFGDVYPHYIHKVERKGKTEKELIQLITWLTGYTKEEIETINGNEITFREFFDNAPNMNEKRELITGSICGIKVQEIEEPLMKNIRQLDKIIDELAKGKKMEKILRK